uniref:winged helix-turn-helix domain-containing protein n=1 Tax=Neorhizobium sp. EC2-8 TaxID=3129230 RepID=UPI003101619E
MTSDLAPRPSRSFAFGPFQLLPERQLLMRGKTPVRIGGRALDILTMLVERPGDVVGKRELLSRVWPATIVEEGNLKVNMAALRRALDEGTTARNISPPSSVAVIGSSRLSSSPVRPCFHPMPR